MAKQIIYSCKGHITRLFRAGYFFHSLVMEFDMSNDEGRLDELFTLWAFGILSLLEDSHAHDFD